MACSNNLRVGGLPPRESIEVTEHWRVAHAYNSALPGWLVVMSRRHVAALHELEPFEASPLGGVLYRASTALRGVVECEKAYVMFFAEAEGHSHVHFHVVPRRRDLSQDALGPRVMTFINRPEVEWLSPEEQDTLALLLAEQMRRLR